MVSKLHKPFEVDTYLAVKVYWLREKEKGQLRRPTTFSHQLT